MDGGVLLGAFSGIGWSMQDIGLARVREEPARGQWGRSGMGFAAFVPIVCDLTS